MIYLCICSPILYLPHTSPFMLLCTGIFFTIYILSYWYKERSVSLTLHPGLSAIQAYKMSCRVFHRRFLSSTSVAHLKSDPPFILTISPSKDKTISVLGFFYFCDFKHIFLILIFVVKVKWKTLNRSVKCKKLFSYAPVL